MSPDDPRHGSWAGYQAGCADSCCRDAARQYQKLRVFDAHRGRPRTVLSLGTRRRIQALACIGWSSRDVATRLGYSHEWVRQVTIRDQIHRTTAEKVAALYDALCMATPPTNTVAQRRMVGKTKARAARNGWAPPLAWDDIDNDESPSFGETDGELDWVVIDRLIAGKRIESTRAEKVEAMRRWLANGGSERALCQVHGWAEGRYVSRGEGAA